MATLATIHVTTSHYSSGSTAHPKRTASSRDSNQRAKMDRTHATSAAAVIGIFNGDVDFTANVPRYVSDQRGAVHADDDDRVALVQRDAGRQ